VPEESLSAEALPNTTTATKTQQNTSGRIHWGSYKRSPDHHSCSQR